VACAGVLAPGVVSPAATLYERLSSEPPQLDDLDGAFAFAHWDSERRTLRLGRDPFGIRALYYVQHGDSFFFATELAQLLAIPNLPIALDPAVIHKYLTFSFVPGEAMPIAGIRRLPPGKLLELHAGQLKTQRYFRLGEHLDERFTDPPRAVSALKRVAQRATQRRLHGERQVGLFLSGGLDSAAVAVWLKQAGVEVQAFSLDFGAHGVEREEAHTVAQTLGIAQHLVPVSAERVADAFHAVILQLELPFGDSVTVPQYLLGRAAQAAGLGTVFNGEGGDQLFGGWTNKPMIAAEVYAGLYESEEDSREERYLRSYHRFYGCEDQLYTEAFKRQMGGAGQRRALLRPYLADGDESFLYRVRMADIALKGSDNILPRAEAMAHASGLKLCMPLFDRKLAKLAFRLPPQLKLQGACEKYVLKLALQKLLPDEIVWRRKSGMSVPATDYVLSPAFAPVLESLLGDAAVRDRGLFRPQFVAQLRAGHDRPDETRRRRVGERLWVLLMLEVWLRRFIDRRPVGSLV
jgi:asparagine synthase (glutamine-hydrolysing)